MPLKPSAASAAPGASAGRVAKKTKQPTQPPTPSTAKNNNNDQLRYLTITATPSINNSLKIVSFNLAGISPALKKGLKAYLAAEKPDIICFQETKLNTDLFPGIFSKSDYPYQVFSHCTAKKTYSGTAILSKLPFLTKPQLTVGDPLIDKEGRYITAEFSQFYLINCYIMNAGQNLERLDAKVKHYPLLEAHLARLQSSKKPIVWCGDLNVCRTPLDLARPDSNHRTAGFTKEEREDIARVMENLNLRDAYRELYPDEKMCYTYYSYRFGCFAKKLGWRLDYFLLSETLMPLVKDVVVRTDAHGISDHVPLVMFIDNRIQSSEPSLTK